MQLFFLTVIFVITAFLTSGNFCASLEFCLSCAPRLVPTHRRNEEVILCLWSLKIFQACRFVWFSCFWSCWSQIAWRYCNRLRQTEKWAQLQECDFSGSFDRSSILLFYFDCIRVIRACWGDSTSLLTLISSSKFIWQSKSNYELKTIICSSPLFLFGCEVKQSPLWIHQFKQV